MTDSLVNKEHEEQSQGALSLLIVEDNAINLRLIQATLARLGHVYDSAVDGSVAVEKFKARNYDAILMDIMMPVMDGIEATIEIRKIEEERQIPRDRRVKIIAITANAFEDDRNRFFEAGMDFYINKPVEIEELRRILSA